MLSKHNPKTCKFCPKRIQRKRVKGWKMPKNTIYVGRPSIWGNPFAIKRNNPHTFYVKTVEEAVLAYQKFSSWVNPGDNKETMIKELRGKNLACWCPLRDKYGKIVPCHADVLLKIANE